MQLLLEIVYKLRMNQQKEETGNKGFSMKRAFETVSGM
jgi:hypothetical protein